ncbi:lanosterol 14-alpha-demethylase [Aaosphaeria arxii CBS 175.79]|uniref:Lanosterol 14-alpha-demethylase n=1 Tax=Aaosphaeria arxii CBS 175.79 TaxID=1450172 RepID=A0A6A5XT83_9PLEO|nr:lanosterol 14-alpha-demethylase [Aaosphaeria arxii CBS 175.79]KAF2015890.1 lanosterol 14-alpha-demethylase [Aaosphaeria arxii CBS 175.79]
MPAPIKRGRQSQGEQVDPKKPRRSQRNLSPSRAADAHLKPGPLPSPITHKESTATDEFDEGTATPPSQIHPDETTSPTNGHSPRRPGGLSSPPSDTQPFSQFAFQANSRAYAVEDEEGEGVWGYLVPFDSNSGDVLVLRRRSACPVSAKYIGTKTGKEKVSRGTYERAEEKYETKKQDEGVTAGGYLIGRHPECDRIINSLTVSNRHCLLFAENKDGDSTAVLEDLSGNGTFVNDTLVGRNKRRVLNEGDEIGILDAARFVFRYPLNRDTNGFRQQYTLQEQLGKGHFASVYLCVEKTTGARYAVKKFDKRSGPGEKSKVDGLQQEIAVLMSVSHPALLCLKDTFDEDDGVYLVLELAPEGELFNWIVMKQKLSESEARKVFVQLFQGIKYLHERNIVHRDIKPENILLTDKELHVKLADFGLAKIIGEESFTTTLCGTPSYVAPEILEGSNHRRYTRAVDVWSLGVVLYICLCGFPPFSDELYSAENPYTLSQQIKMGRFDYPSPYWDSVGDPALDLIDRMLTVDVDQRITVDECLQHPWVTQQVLNPADSTDGLTGAIANLDFSKRKVQRERTLLSTINDIRVSRVIDAPGGQLPIKVYEKNATKNGTAKKGAVGKETTPAANRDPEEFIKLGGKGDQRLYDTEDGSRYPESPEHSRVRANREIDQTGLGERGTGVSFISYGSENIQPDSPTLPFGLFSLFSFPLSVCNLIWCAMGILAEISGPLAAFTANSSLPVLIAAGVGSFLLLSVVVNVLCQLLFKSPNEPPLVFHWFPLIGSTVTYGIDPVKFFFENKKKYGNVFTFVLLGNKVTVYLDTKGNNFILNGKLKDVNAEEIYSCLTTPVFGKDVVYDCPNSKLMEQKKFVKFGLTQDALRSYVKLITAECNDFFRNHKAFNGQKGTFDVSKVLAELTIYTASRSLQGKEVRNSFDSSFAGLYHDLDMGFSPINFMLSWAPLPHNRARDIAREKMIQLYSGIVRDRRSGAVKKDSHDMIWHLIECKYKDGTPIPEHEIAGIMIALLMAGQHSSASTISWALLRLASKPELIEELLQEQKEVLGADLPDLTYEDLSRLPLHAQIIKETLRLHAPIHSILRLVKQPLVVEGTNYLLPPNRRLLAAPGVSAQMDEHFVNPAEWDPHRWDAGKGTYEEKEDDTEDKIDYGWGVVSKGTNSPYLPFGAGRHRCIGEQFAYLQLQTILVAFVREFKLRNIDGSRKVVDTDYTSLFSKPQQPDKVEFQRRNVKN